MADDTTARMRRALYDDLGHDLATKRAESYEGSSRRIAGMEIAGRRWNRIRTLRWLIRNSEMCATRNPRSRAVYDALDDLLFEDAVRNLQVTGGPLEFGAALQGALREEEKPKPTGPAVPYWSTRADELVRSFQRLGPERSGLLLEVIAPPGSGKSNLLAYLGRTAMANGHEVFCNFEVSRARLEPTPGADKLGEFRLARSARELLPQLIRFARGKPRRVGFFLCDEAGGRGMSSGTASTTEAQDALLFFQQSRKFRINSVRARQIHNVPTAQQELAVGRIEFRTDSPQGAPGRLGEHMPLRVEWTHGAPPGAPVEAIGLPVMRRFYDTFEQASFEWDVRMGAMWSYVNRHAKGSKAQLKAIERFLALPPAHDAAAGSPSVGPKALPPASRACPRCRYSWVPRLPFPKRCPNPECGERWPLGRPSASRLATTAGKRRVSVSTRARRGSRLVLRKRRRRSHPGTTGGAPAQGGDVAAGSEVGARGDEQHTSPAGNGSNPAEASAAGGTGVPERRSP